MMKKMILVAIMAMLSLNAIAQTVSFLDVKNKEIAIIVNPHNGGFKEYFLFQYENLNLPSLVGGDCQITHVGEELLLKFSNRTLSFSLTGKSKVPGATVYPGYGLSHRRGEYFFNPTPPQNPEFMYQLINRKIGDLIQPIPTEPEMKCHSGGAGSSECSIDAMAVVGGGGCSVKCRDGYYSCCDDTRNECRCMKEMTKPK